MSTLKGPLITPKIDNRSPAHPIKLHQQFGALHPQKYSNWGFNDLPLLLMPDIHFKPHFTLFSMSGSSPDPLCDMELILSPKNEPKFPLYDGGNVF